ncbi:MAG: hypothetical protein MRY83_05810, partial [Flavobacteriales bacterium]|nr:hypothetical protein [Flavobacteriales bacterium]
IPYNTGSEQACGFYEEHRGHAFFASNPPTKNILLFDKGTIQYEISNLHFLMVTNNTSDFKHMASKEIFQYDRGYECVYTGKSNDNFFKIFKKVINEEISTFHFVEVRVGDEPLETIQINGNNIEKGTELYFEYAFEKIDDPKLKEQIKDCIEYRLRYLLLDLPELKNDHLPDYNLERFTISDIHSLMK